MLLTISTPLKESNWDMVCGFLDFSVKTCYLKKKQCNLFSFVWIEKQTRNNYVMWNH